MAYVRCWTCVGNGRIIATGEICKDCGGTGADLEKTMKHIPEWDRSIPTPLIDKPKNKNHGKIS